MSINRKTYYRGEIIRAFVYFFAYFAVLGVAYLLNWTLDGPVDWITLIYFAIIGLIATILAYAVTYVGVK